MAAKVEAGTYQCKTTAATIYEAPSGAVMCRMALDIGLTGGICLIQKDGTLSERGFRDVQAILGMAGAWDWDLWAREPSEWAGHEVEAVIEVVHGDKGEYSSVKYLNPIGGNIAKADAKSLAAKYGAKTRAMFGGAPAAPSRPKPPAAPKPPPPAAVEPSTMEACWDEWLKVGNDGDADKWYADVEKMAGKKQSECGPADWGRMFAELGKLLPK